MEMKALVLNDYPDNFYALAVALRVKTIETRMREFKYRGDLVICCGGQSASPFQGEALCVVRLTDVVPMEAHHQDKAWVPALPGRMAYILKDWRWFSYRWSFASRRVSGAFQGIFTVEVPKDVSIVSYMPEWLANAHLTLNGKDYRYTPSGLVDIDARRPSSSLD